MKKNIAYAVLNFVGVAAVFAFLDLVSSSFNMNTFVQTFTQPSHLFFTGIFGLITSVGTFFSTRKKVTAA